MKSHTQLKEIALPADTNLFNPAMSDDLNVFLDKLLKNIIRKKFYIRNKFYIEGISKEWVEGVPANVQAILTLIQNMHRNDLISVIKTFNSIASTLQSIPDSNTRHYKTTLWYYETLRSVNAILVKMSAAQQQVNSVTTMPGAQPAYYIATYDTSGIQQQGTVYYQPVYPEPSSLPSYMMATNVSGSGLFGHNAPRPAVRNPASSSLTPVYIGTYNSPSSHK